MGDTLQTHVDESVRQRTRLNHSATHLLHAALREVLGEHVTQKGSLVDSARLRFDFSHFEGVTDEEIAQIEQIVNTQIRANTQVDTRVMSMDEAVEAGAMALFGEKYGDEVRVLSMGEHNFSVELCGGTHVGATGDIGLFKIISEAGVASGVRRIEALTGQGALQWVRERLDLPQLSIADIFGAPTLGGFISRVEALISRGNASAETTSNPAPAADATRPPPLGRGISRPVGWRHQPAPVAGERIWPAGSGELGTARRDLSLGGGGHGRGWADRAC